MEKEMNKAGKESRTLSRIDLLKDKVDTIESKLGALTEQLNPLMVCPPPSVGEGNMKEAEDRSRVITELDDLSNRLQDIINAIEDVRDRLEI